MEAKKKIGKVSIMRFRIEAGEMLHGELRYVHHECAIDFIPADSADVSMRIGDSGTESLLVNELQLATSVDTGEVLFPWGYLPKPGWRMTQLRAPVANNGRIFLVSEVMSPGEPKDIIEGRWNVDYDADTGWVKVHRGAGGGQCVSIAPGVVMDIVDGILESVWLNPEFN
ncbi:hypothetical protein [Nocardia sp. AG03]|uniref:hypothetical protein n=1 Tax=Nocardia sp. AG03 TaxID=3025312 RepID=UPI0024188CB9|nr:hypothetical protein [Nocardia sp. AG03]